MPDMQLVTADELDYEAFVELQRQAFGEVLAGAGSSPDYMSTAFYRWKYHPPAGPALVAVVYEGDQMVAAKAMLPVEMRRGDLFVKGWQTCDAATAPTARRKGHFTGCLRMLMDALRPGEIFFGFPNRNSIHGFIKLGWASRALVTTWVNPIALGAREGDPRVETISRWTANFDILADRLAESQRAHVRRTAAYLNWRYSEHPVHRYHAFVYRDGDGLAGLVVVRSARAMNTNVTLVMDLWGVRPEVERILLHRAAAWAHTEGTPTLVLLDTAIGTLNAALAGFLPVPAVVLPKRQVFMGFVKEDQAAAAEVFASSWRVQTGDWDAF